MSLINYQLIMQSDKIMTKTALKSSALHEAVRNDSFCGCLILRFVIYLLLACIF